MSTASAQAASAAPAAFHAVLVPHRSLSRDGFRALVAVLIGANLILGVPMFALGAWPIVGFMGLDVALVVWLFRLNYRSGRLTETLTLADGTLAVERIDPEGEVERTTFDAYWLRVEMDDPPVHESRLTLVSRGQRLVIGRFLTPDERLEIAVALRAALARARDHRFDHPWDRGAV
ncbi:MAG: DUF2244 domain-containing protein [Rhodospirillales bacterium]|nr:DUF2244 domain-containing protein [Rhodospirillales bacterium]QQS11803.1 MAG: DUF2244 domain-containing protein [Rhodospirillales bacterium]